MVAHHVIRRQHQQQGVRVDNLIGRGGDGGGGVARGRFQQDRARRDAFFAQLLGDHEPVRLVTDDCGRREAVGRHNAAHRFDDQALGRDQGQELLGILRPGHRPESCACAA
jgi:hypothetical protein